MEKFMKKFMFLCLMALTLALVIPAGSAKAASDTIHQGVFIGDVDVSGMTTAQATEAVNQYIEQLRAKNVTLTGRGEDHSVQVTMGAFGLGWANPEVVDEAYSLCRKGNIIQRYKAMKDLEHSTQRYDIQFSFNDDAIYQILEVDCAPFNVSKVNYNLTKTADGFNVSEGQTGYILDEQTSLKNIEDFVQNSWDHNDCSIPVVIEEDLPQGSYEELSQVKDVLGTFTTSYSTSGAARSANVANGCSLINGTTVYPGEEFSVLDTITPFTESNGYFPAGSYLNGVVVESVGGGICQVSTTLYNAVLKAELEVTERHNHSMIINYVQPSMDAAIAENGGKNFKFVNSTEHPIYIEGSTTSDKHITFTIYGVETRPSSHKVEFESEVLETTPAGADQVVADGGSPVGVVNVQSAHIGYKAQLWKITYENGSVSDRQVINSSTYKMVPRIITVGTATADPTAASQIATAIATGDINQIKAVAGAIAAIQQVAADGGDVEAAQAAAAAQAASAEAQLAAQQAAEGTPAPEGGEAAPAETPAPAPTPAPATNDDTPAPIDPIPEEVPPPAD